MALSRYQRNKESNKAWAVRNPEAVHAIQRRSVEKKRAALIESLGGVCLCGSKENLRVVGGKRKQPGNKLLCGSCLEAEKSLLKTRQSNWNSEKAKRRRANLTPEQKQHDREVLRASAARYRKRHADRRNLLKHKRRAAKLLVPNSLTKTEWDLVLRACDNLCLCCGQAKKLTIDHVVPLDHRGEHTLQNVQPLCGVCNSAKGTKSTDYRPADWFSRLANLTNAKLCDKVETA